MIQSYPWYIDDYRKSERVLGMNNEQQGLFRNLLDMCWDQGDLPTDVAMLQKLGLSTPKEWKRAWPVVSQMFFERDGRLHNAKVDAKRPEVLKGKAGRSSSASHAAQMRWAAQEDAAPDAQRSAEPMRDACADECGTDAQRSAEAMPDACAAQCESNAVLCGTPSPSPSPSPYSGGEEASGVVRPPPPPRNKTAQASNGTAPWWESHWKSVAEGLVLVRRHAGNLQHAPPRDPDREICLEIGACFETYLDFAEWVSEKAKAKQGGDAHKWSWFRKLARAEGTRRSLDDPAVSGGA